jgi:hypothetical protein
METVQEEGPDMNGHKVQARPTWEEYRTCVRNEELVAAMTLLEVDPYATVRNDAARWLSWSQRGDGRMVAGVLMPNPQLDWEAWVTDVESLGRGWSSSQWRMYDVVAGLTANRPFNIVGVLDRLNEWGTPAWCILAAWGSGANADQIRGAGRR